MSVLKQYEKKLLVGLMIGLLLMGFCGGYVIATQQQQKDLVLKTILSNIVYGQIPEVTQPSNLVLSIDTPSSVIVGSSFRVNITVENPNSVDIYCHFRLNMTLNNPAETVTANSVIVQATNLSIHFSLGSSVDGNTWQKVIPWVADQYVKVPPGTSYYYVELILNTYCLSIDYAAWFE